MKKIIFRIIPVLSFVVCLYSCSNSPESVAIKAMASIQKGDYEAYADTYNISPSEKKVLVNMCEEKIGNEVTKRGGIKRYKITDTVIDGDNADVTVHVIYKDGHEDDMTMTFNKVDGKWKQELNK